MPHEQTKICPAMYVDIYMQFDVDVSYFVSSYFEIFCKNWFYPDFKVNKSKTGFVQIES
jgi:hypothetical protein